VDDIRIGYTDDRPRPYSNQLKTLGATSNDVHLRLPGSCFFPADLDLHSGINVEALTCERTNPISEANFSLPAKATRVPNEDFTGEPISFRKNRRFFAPKPLNPALNPGTKPGTDETFPGFPPVFPRFSVHISAKYVENTSIPHAVNHLPTTGELEKPLAPHAALLPFTQEEATA
jgi:hypothetical protein